MDRDTWLARNRSAVTARLRWLNDKPDGTICVELAGSQFAVVTKAGSEIRLLLLDQVKPRSSLTQSHLDLKDPLHLVAPYSQAATLGLLWQNEPHRVYIAGLGGGRVPLVMHHYFPDAVIECTEIEPAVIGVAEKYFGVRTDERLRVAVEDGREWLAQREQHVRYDIIFVDAYLGTGYAPYRLATTEFYALCQEHMGGDGVLVVNLLRSGPHYADKVKTIQAAFGQVYLCPVPGDNSLVFATHGPPLDKAELINRAVAVQDFHRFTFPFVERAKDLIEGSCLRSHVADLNGAQVLGDGSPPRGYLDRLPSFSSPFSRQEPGHPCPCGSGRSFADCHGQQGT